MNVLGIITLSFQSLRPFPLLWHICVLPSIEWLLLTAQSACNEKHDILWNGEAVKGACGLDYECAVS